MSYLKQTDIDIKPDMYIRESRRDEALYKGKKRYLFVFNIDRLFKNIGTEL